MARLHPGFCPVPGHGHAGRRGETGQQRRLARARGASGSRRRCRQADASMDSRRSRGSASRCGTRTLAGTTAGRASRGRVPSVPDLLAGRLNNGPSTPVGASRRGAYGATARPPGPAAIGSAAVDGSPVRAPRLRNRTCVPPPSPIVVSSLPRGRRRRRSRPDCRGGRRGSCRRATTSGRGRPSRRRRSGADRRHRRGHPDVESATPPCRSLAKAMSGHRATRPGRHRCCPLTLSGCEIRPVGIHDPDLDHPERSDTNASAAVR